MSDQLEDIQSKFEARSQLSEEEMMWLISQATRFEQLENTVRENLDKRALPYRLKAWLLDLDSGRV